MYSSPDNLVELLDGIARLAARARFYVSILPEGVRVRSMGEFAALPITPIADYRRQRLADVLAQPERVEAVVARRDGHDPRRVAVVEGTDEAAERFDIFADAVRGSVALGPETVCVVLADPRRRYFGAEIATILIRAGAVAHVLVAGDGSDSYRALEALRPRVLALLTPRVDEARLPDSVELCVTFGGARRLRRFPQVDILVVDELGFLGQSRAHPGALPEARLHSAPDGEGYPGQSRPHPGALPEARLHPAPDGEGYLGQSRAHPRALPEARLHPAPDGEGYLGQSRPHPGALPEARLHPAPNGEGYLLNEDSYHFERSPAGRLVVTSLFNRVQPLLRIETEEVVGPLGGGLVKVRRGPSAM